MIAGWGRNPREYPGVAAVFCEREKPVGDPGKVCLVQLIEEDTVVIGAVVDQASPKLRNGVGMGAFARAT
ncbi:hypothetical protein MBOURGENBZM_03530 [Methanoculleus bourgensis]|nr:hypothetical protein MBOURGENBZM_03530 [Methanoculleus bourgensis]